MNTSCSYRRIIGLAVIGLCILIGFGYEAAAQGTRTMDAAARRIDDLRRQSEKAERDQMAKEINGRKATPDELKRNALVREQLKEDFESLQTEYNVLVTRLKAREPLDAAETNAIGERVHSRSTRILKNLNLPEIPESERAEQKTRELASVKALCLKIFAFITHPMFESPSAIDVKGSAEVRKVLEEIISMSDELRRSK